MTERPPRRWSRLRAALAKSTTLRRVVTRVRGHHLQGASPAQQERVNYVTQHAGHPVAVVGLGRQGQSIAVALGTIGYRVAGVCDVDRARLKAFAAQHTDVFVTTSFDDLMHQDPSVVVIATLADARAALIEQLAAAGVRHILCEKPIATTVRDCRTIRALAERHDLNIKVHTPRSWLPEYRHIAEIISSGQLGDLRRIELRFKSHGFGNLGSHYLPLAFQLVGRGPVAVRTAWFDEARVFSRTSPYADRNGRAEYILDGGVELCADNCERPVRGPAFVKLVFTDGQITCREGPIATYSVCDARACTTHEKAFGDGAITARTQRALCFSLDRILSELIAEHRDRSFEWAAASVEAIVAAQWAHARGERVELPLAPDVPTSFLFT